MAKRVKGHRANKPNDSFGTIDQDSLYKGKYREEVYKDDDDDEESEEAVEAQEAEQEEQVEAPKAESFATKEKSEPDYKKRYDDLKRHYDTKLSEWQLEKDELITRLNTTPQKTDQAPPTDLDNFRHQYPDMYEAIEKISSTQSEARVRNLPERALDLGPDDQEVGVQADRVDCGRPVSLQQSRARGHLRSELRFARRGPPW